MFIDSATIIVRSGKGGDGAVSFRREKYIPKGGPDGGDGGDGGSVYLLAEPGTSTLHDMAGRHHWFAEDGKPGARKQQIGKSGEDLTIRLPPGTLVYDDQSGDLLADLDDPGKTICIAEGGKGGYGNERFKSATNQTPREATPGEPSVEKHLRLELKLIADVGLIGKPNAGKSTLLAAVSRARPKIAGYAFTTLEPNLGIVELDGDRRLVLADIPGLIEGAHRGAGLGTRFLRHIERTRVLLHLVEWEPADGSDPIENVKVIRRELAEHSQVLADKPELVAISKAELLGNADDQQAAVDMLEQALGVRAMVFSSASGEGLDAMLTACYRVVTELAAQR